MNVTDLIEVLKELPPDCLVLLSSDGEGNSFSPFSGDYALGRYAADTAWSGDFYNEDEDDIPSRAVKAIVLWPTN